MRSLAQRSAEAANDTAEKIEHSIKLVASGVKVCAEVGNALSEIQTNSEKAACLAKDISLASKEQATGIDQVNKSVAELDQVTQANAASSEEVAAAAEELSAQAGFLRDLVADLDTLVHGTTIESSGPSKYKQNFDILSAPVSSDDLDHAKGSTSAWEDAPPSTVFPLDDGDFGGM